MKKKRTRALAYLALLVAFLLILFGYILALPEDGESVHKEPLKFELD